MGLAVLCLFAAVGEERPLGATEWLNSEPLGPAELRGHVVRERERDAIGVGEVQRSVSYTVASTSRRMASSVAATS